jgi:hypothetical protein
VVAGSDGTVAQQGSASATLEGLEGAQGALPTVSADGKTVSATFAFPRYYRRITGWALGWVLCADLSGDGRREMVVQQLCCTGGALSPYAIFRQEQGSAGS